MSGNKIVVGVFKYLDDTLRAIEFAKAEGKHFKVYSPVPVHEIMDSASPERSPIALVTGTGAITGLTFGFGLCILCNLDWPIRVSAKPIVSIPAFIPVGYECTILFGAIFTLIALFHFCRIPDIFRAPGYDPRFSQDKFGIVVGCQGNELDAVSERLKSFGAEEVTVGDSL